MANEKAQVIAPNMVSKLTMRTIKIQPTKHATDKGAPVAVVIGYARGIKEVTDKVRGDVFHALVGEFEAQNLETGEFYRSGVLYLPAGIHDMLESSVKKLEGETDFVSFALQILAVKASNPAGYSYEAKSLMPAKAVDPLEELRAELGGGTQSKALPASTAKK